MCNLPHHFSGKFTIPLLVLLAIVLTAVVVAGPLYADINFTWDRAVYWDVRYPTCFTHGRSLRDAFEFDGYKILDADQLKTWMDARIADGMPSVVVFCQDIAPDTVVESMSHRCTLRRYLDAGGKIVWYADIPMCYQGHSNGTRTDWGNNGSINILGFNAGYNAGYGPWDSEDEVAFTVDGVNWGLTETWQSERPISPSGLRVLATDDRGNAAAWVKHYVPGDSYRGFVRLFDRVGEPHFNDVQRVAEYNARKAEAPQPSNGAMHEDTRISLSWSPSIYAASHDVYFGENFDDVNYGTGGTFRGNKTETNFIVGSHGFDYPDGLVPGTTYYWRVDEVDGVNTYKGDVWSFTISSKTAYEPNPADGAIHGDTWVNLSWFAGETAVSHTVYFGDNFDDVKNGAEGTFRGNQAETFFIAGFPGFPYPDGLVPGTTYYWRIDEVNDTEPNSPWKGNVWSFSISPNAAYAPGHFAITYYDNYNYDTGQWDAWQSDATPRDAWDDKYLADGSSGKTVYTDHAFTSITTFDLRGGLFSKDGHASDGEDWNPLQSIGDNVSGQSAHHVFAALFKGLIYLEEGDNLMVASDDDVYVFLDGDTAWGQEVLSVPSVSHFGTDSMTVTAAQEGYHMITVKYIERLNDHSGIEITVNGVHLQNAEVVIDIKPGSYPLSEALDTILSFTTGGSADWISQTTTSYYGQDAAQSGDISDNQESWMQTTVSGTGTVKFYWMVSSEEDFDFLEFYIDGSLQEKISGSEDDWERQTYTISTSGSHTLEWRYMKDGRGDEDSDCGWVDKVEWVTN